MNLLLFIPSVDILWNTYCMPDTVLDIQNLLLDNKI